MGAVRQRVKALTHYSSRATLPHLRNAMARATDRAMVQDSATATTPIPIDTASPLRSFRRGVGDMNQTAFVRPIGITQGTYGASERSGEGVRVSTVARALRAYGYRLVMTAEPVAPEAPANGEGERRADLAALVGSLHRRAFAEEMGITKGALSNLLNGHARVTDEMLARARAAASALKTGGVAP